MKILAFPTDPPVVSAILLHLDLPHKPPPLSPARGPPQSDLVTGLLDQTPALGRFAGPRPALASSAHPRIPAAHPRIPGSFSRPRLSQPTPGLRPSPSQSANPRRATSPPTTPEPFWTLHPSKEVGFFDTVPWNEAPGFDGSWSNYPFFASGTIVVTSGKEGVPLLRRQVRPVS
jgi:hypothetical protein